MIKKTNIVVFLNILIVCFIVLGFTSGNAQSNLLEKAEIVPDSIVQKEPEVSQDIQDENRTDTSLTPITANDSSDNNIQNKNTDTTDNSEVNSDATTNLQDNDERHSSKKEETVVTEAPVVQERKRYSSNENVTAKTETARESPAAGNAELTILDISDTHLKLKRIPELKISEQDQITAVLDSRERASEETKNSKEKGFFSINKPNKGWFDEWGPKIALLVIVIAMFILYRLKSRKKRRKIFRKIPKR
jgi:hypothetical protein